MAFLKEYPLTLFQEFKAFAVKGNVIDLAVGVIVGAAFGKIVNSLVNDVITPWLALITGTVDFSDKILTLRDATETTAAVTVKYGLFINTVLEFFIVGFAVFLLVKQVNRWKRKDPAPEPTTRECPFCYSVISKKATKCPQCTSSVAAIE